MCTSRMLCFSATRTPKRTGWHQMRPFERLQPLMQHPYNRMRRVITPERIAKPVSSLAGGCVALTFDDGPHPAYTHEVLDVLADHEIPATFFVVGRNARRHPEILRRILGEGHSVASHSMTHTDPWLLTPAELWRDYRAGHLEVSSVAGRDVRLFRPPKGHLDRRSAVAIRAARLRTVLWSVDPSDWEPHLGPQDILERIGKPVAGDIVLLHDAVESPHDSASLDRSATVRAVAKYLEYAVRDGTTFTSLQ